MPTPIDRHELQRLLAAAERTSWRRAMTLGPSTVRPSARLEGMVERMQRQKLTNLPVTTSDGRLIALLTLRDTEGPATRGG